MEERVYANILRYVLSLDLDPGMLSTFHISSQFEVKFFQSFFLGLLVFWTTAAFWTTTTFWTATASWTTTADTTRRFIQELISNSATKLSERFSDRTLTSNTNAVSKIRSEMNFFQLYKTD